MMEFAALVWTPGVAVCVDVDQADPDLNTHFSGAAFLTTTDDPHTVASLSGDYLDADFGFYEIVPGSIGSSSSN